MKERNLICLAFCRRNGNFRSRTCIMGRRGHRSLYRMDKSIWIFFEDTICILARENCAFFISSILLLTNIAIEFYTFQLVATDHSAVRHICANTQNYGELHGSPFSIKLRQLFSESTSLATSDQTSGRDWDQLGGRC